jgi:hypothetical protein
LALQALEEVSRLALRTASSPPFREENSISTEMDEVFGEGSAELLDDAWANTTTIFPRSRQVG